MPLSDLTEHDAAIHYARPDAVIALHGRSELLRALSADERERHARFRFERDQDTYLVAHVLVRRVLARVAGVASDALEFASAEHGRPELVAPASACELRFNLSHTHGLVACAVTRRADIGVDVEQSQREVEILGVAKHVYSDAEIAALTALPIEARQERFFELWTLKEAYIKAIGKGFSAPLRAITFDPSRPDPVPVRFGVEIQDDAASWCMRRFDVGREHRLALALRAGASSRIHCSELQPRELG